MGVILLKCFIQVYSYTHNLKNILNMFKIYMYLRVYSFLRDPLGFFWSIFVMNIFNISTYTKFYLFNMYTSLMVFNIFNITTIQILKGKTKEFTDIMRYSVVICIQYFHYRLKLVGIIVYHQSKDYVNYAIVIKLKMNSIFYVFVMRTIMNVDLLQRNIQAQYQFQQTLPN